MVCPASLSVAMSGFVELHAHSYYSLLDGTSSPAALVEQVAALGMEALALTDRDAVYGAVEFVEAAKAAGIRPILGAELTLADDSPLTLLVESEAGWSNLCQLITAAQHNAPKGEARLPKGKLAEHADGLIALSGGRQGAISQALLGGEQAKAEAIGRRLRDVFGRNSFFLELNRHHLAHEKWLNLALEQLANSLGVGIVATNAPHYATQSDAKLHDVLTCIRHLTTLDESELLRLPNAEFYLKSAAQMGQLFHHSPQAIRNTRRIADRCHFNLLSGLQTLPPYPIPDGTSGIVFLKQRCKSSARVSLMKSVDGWQALLAHELGIIERAGLANYFLLVWDVCRFAREQRIPYQGRGSAANSLVAYLLHISPINPMQHGLVFERFLSAERANMPDIDIDFCSVRREEVIQYIYKRYGAEHVAMACTFSTFRSRGAARDAAKVLGLTADDAAHALDWLHQEKPPPLESLSRPLRQLVEICQQLIGIPRHLGLHNGGIIISHAPLATRVPIEPATMADRTVVQWDKDGLDSADMIKLDVLGLRMLSAMQTTIDLIEEQASECVDLDALTYDDPNVFNMISEADTMGVFQVESRAQAQVLPRIRPNSFNDLVVTISLIRPGPIQANAVHPYIRRREGTEPVEYLHPLLQPALEETHGVLLFQEQVLKVARDVASFSAGEGELLRRALGKKNATAAIGTFRTRFVEGAVGNGVSAEIAEAIFQQLEAFGSYSFAKAHAASFAVLVYRSAWLRCYHPSAFYCRLLRHQPMGFWSPSVLVGDARRRGIQTLPVDIALSSAECSLEGRNIRLGFDYVKGFSTETATQLVQQRIEKPFANLSSLCKRTRLPRRLIEALITAGALDRWGDRRQLLWQLAKLRYRENELPYPDNETTIPLQELDSVQKQAFEMQVTGLTTGPHVMAQLRPKLQARGILSSGDLNLCHSGKRVTIAGLLVIRQSPQTARGFSFLTIEDNFGLMNVIVRPQLLPRYRRLLQHERLLEVTGIVERQGAIINIMMLRMHPLSV